MNMHHHYADGCFRFWINNFSLIEISKRFGFSLSIELPSDWHEESRAILHINLIWPNIFIGIPWPFKRFKDHGQCSGFQLGFSFFEDLLWIYHGNDTGKSNDRSRTTIHMPWGWSGNTCVQSVLNANGEWVEFVGSWDKDKASDGRVKETHDYTYTLKNGEVQHRKATIFVEKREWHRNWWFPRDLVRENIDISFDDEVGEGTGSWKGGTVGTGHDLLPGETPLECLRRMEKERTF